MYITNPYTEQREEFEETPLSELKGLYNRIVKRTSQWSTLPIPKRVEALRSVMNQLSADRKEFETAISLDMGKPIRWCRVEIDRSLDETKDILDHAESWLRERSMPEGVSNDKAQGYVRYDPLGTVAVIAPWNFPVLIPLRGIIPALVSGNTVVFKPSELTLRVGKRLVSLFEKMIDPCPLVGVYGDRDLGEEVVKLPVSLIAFTGSSETGKKIARVAADSMKRCVFELGGLDAALVLQDADIASTAKELVLRNTANSGQACSAVKRVFADGSVYKSLIDAILEEEKKLTLGDPFDEKTDLGPLASANQLKRVESFVIDAREKGAKILRGGNRPGRTGFFFEPTVISEVPATTRLLSEEPFGPVMPVLQVNSIDEAVSRANETRYGLMASIFSRDTERAEKIATLLDAGSVCINSHFPGGSGTPFGGVKESGYGRIRSEAGLHEFTNVKFVKTRT